MAEDPDALVDLVRTSNELQAVSLIAELESHGIQAKAFNVGVMQYQMPMMQGQRVVVRRGDLERAREVLAAYEPARVEIDWDNVDTGDEAPLLETEAPDGGPRFVCPRCGYSRDGLTTDARCPECGAAAAQWSEAQQGGMPRYLIWIVVAALLLLLLLGLVF